MVTPRKRCLWLNSTHDTVWETGVVMRERFATGRDGRAYGPALTELVARRRKLSLETTSYVWTDYGLRTRVKCQNGVFFWLSLPNAEAALQPHWTGS